MIWRMRSPRDLQALPLAQNNSAVARETARELHEAFKSRGRFPLFWESIQYDVDKLMDIFEFFFKLEMIMSFAPGRFLNVLHGRLRARFYGDALPMPFGYEAVIEHFSQLQIAAFEFLKSSDLIKPAFELFVVGALNGARPQVFTKDGGSEFVDVRSEGPSPRYPEPDSAIFFYWAEFALVAACAGHDVANWREIIPILLRDEQLYALCYGKPVHGIIPKDTTFNSYDLAGFSTISPEEASRLPYPESKTFESLEKQATSCARFAFPGGVQEVAAHSQ